MTEQRTKKILRIRLHASSSERIRLTTVEVLGKLRAVYAQREKAGTLPRRQPEEGENAGKREEEDADGPGRDDGPLGDNEAWRICGDLAWALADDKTLSEPEVLARLVALPERTRRQLTRWLEAKAETVRAVWPEKRLTKNQSLQLVALGGDWLETVLADEGMLAYTLERLQRLDLQALLLAAED
jgi:hypothetical protein